MCIRDRPTPVHVRGFLRNYARFLGLDPQPLLTRYAAGQGQDAPPPMAETREITPDNPLVERQDQPFFDPVNMEVNGKSGYGVGSGGSGGMLQIVIIVALVIALALIANRFIPILFGRGEEGNAVEEVSAAVRDMVAEVTGATPTPSTTPKMCIRDRSIEERAIWLRMRRAATKTNALTTRGTITRRRMPTTGNS